MIDTNTLFLLERSLDAASLRQRVISDNIANVDTPYYKSKEVSFEKELQQALHNNSKFIGYRTDSRHLEIGKYRPAHSVRPEIFVRSNGAMNNNGNNVDIDYETINMAKNSMWQQALVQQTNGYFQKLRMVIEGRGR